MSDQDKKKCGWYGFTPDDNMTPNNIMISQETLCVSEYLNCKAYLIILMIQSAPWILISLFSKNVIKHDRVEKHLHSHKDSEASFSLLLCKLRIRKTFFFNIDRNYLCWVGMLRMCGELFRMFGKGK